MVLVEASYDRITFDKIKLTASKYVGAAMIHDMSIRAVDNIVNGLVVELSSAVLSEEICKDEYIVEGFCQARHYASWWQHFKSTHFNGWLLHKFPPKLIYEEIPYKRVVKLTRKATYPKSNLAFTGSKAFMDVMGEAVIRDYVEDENGRPL